MKPGRGSLRAGVVLNPTMFGARARYLRKFDDSFYGYAEAQGGYLFPNRQWFGEASAGIGINF